MTTRTSVQSLNLSLSRRIMAGLACGILGLGIVYAVGFADMALAHNAAHDTRHAVGFP